MGDRKIEYDDRFGFNTFKKEIIREIGEESWQELSGNTVLPNIETESACGCENMVRFMDRFDKLVDKNSTKAILSRVRHGLKPSQCIGAREKFLECGNLDQFLDAEVQRGIADFEEMFMEGKDFYGQPITGDVLEFVKQNPAMLSGVRVDNELHLMSFPANMELYLQTDDSRMKRYHACHCPFAKESILSVSPVSKTLCYCSFGHVINYWEAVFNRELDGEVTSSVLNGDLFCKYVVYLPDDIMQAYVE